MCITSNVFYRIRNIYRNGNWKVENYKRLYYSKKQIFENRTIKTIYVGGGTPSYIDANYIKQIFETIKEASIKYNIKASNIVMCCKGKYKYAGRLENGDKLFWEYIKN